MNDTALNGNSGAPEPLLIGAKVAASMLGISARSLWALTNAGAIPVVRLGRRTLYSPAALRSWIEQRTEGGGK